MTTPFTQVVITTPRLLLRPLRASDAAALFTIRSDETVMKYINRLPWTSIDQAHEKIAQSIAAMQSNEFLMLGITTLDGGDLIGTCLLFHFDLQCKRAEVGYEMRPDTWGRGYMNEALKVLLSFGFKALSLNRIEADIDPLNAGSAKTLERLGFQREGLLRERWILNDKKSDSAIYGLLASDYGF